MTDREKLIELIDEAAELYPSELETIADHLIANGVTVRRWIPVTERLPEPHNLVLCLWEDINGVYRGFARYQHDDVWYVSNEGMPKVTHWMPLPKPPKEGER